MIRILFIEETFETREIIKDYFQSEAVPGFSIDFACDMQSGLDKVRAKPYDLLLVDCKPSGEAGLDACRRLREKAVMTLECSGVRMNPVTGLVTVDGRVVELTPRSTGILRLLLENKNAAVSRDEILNKVWGDGFNGSERVADTHIKNLRQSLGKKGDLIRTIKGIGYKIREK